jgi:hypothetical protein
MAFLPEEKIARTVSRIFDSISLDTQLAARLTIGNMTYMVQSKFFDYIIYCLAEFHSQGEENENTAYRPAVIKAIYKALEKEGFVPFTYTEEG